MHLRIDSRPNACWKQSTTAALRLSLTSGTTSKHTSFNSGEACCKRHTRVHAAVHEELIATTTSKAAPALKLPPVTPEPAKPLSLPRLNQHRTQSANDREIEKLLAQIHRRLGRRPSNSTAAASQFHAANRSTFHPSATIHDTSTQLSEDAVVFLDDALQFPTSLDPQNSRADVLSTPLRAPSTTNSAIITSLPRGFLTHETHTDSEIPALQPRPGVPTDEQSQRAWLQELLERPPAIPAAAARKTTGARTKQCGCGNILHNRTKVCPACGKEFYGKRLGPITAAVRTATTDIPSTMTPPPHVSSTAASHDTVRFITPVAATTQSHSAHLPHTASLLSSQQAANGTGSVSVNKQRSKAMAVKGLGDVSTEPPTPCSCEALDVVPCKGCASSSKPAAGKTGANLGLKPSGSETNEKAAERIAAALGLPLLVTTRLLASNKALATLPPSDMRNRITLLATTLNISQDISLAIATRQPALLSLTPATVRHHFQGLCTALQLPPVEMRRAVTKCPDLLLGSPTTVSRKITRIAGMLRVPTYKVIRLMMAAPKLVSLSNENLRSKLLFYCDVLGLQPGRLHKVLAAHPSLLTRSVKALQARLHGTAAHLGLSEPEARRVFQLMPSLFYKDSASVEVKVSDLAALLGVPQEHAARLVAQNVGLLACSTEGWGAKVDALGEALGLGREAVVKMLTRSPALLGLQPEGVKKRMAVMAGKMKLPLRKVRELVEAQPSLLTVRPLLISRRWKALGEVAALDSSWRQQLLTYQPSSLAMLLSRSNDVFLRLKYLADDGLSSGVSVSTVASYSTYQFGVKYPGFMPWVNTQGLAKKLKKARK